ncbi:hypothetical protein [Brucella endophytica]|uniref:hypothetical protein n=1 Tax=Brucella endophytica TaxID=1963359 RepID=UPI0016688033|nr:hypothetical protein [Brucella endophytica]
MMGPASVPEFRPDLLGSRDQAKFIVVGIDEFHILADCFDASQKELVGRQWCIGAIERIRVGIRVEDSLRFRIGTKFTLRSYRDTPPRTRVMVIQF